jgi:transposase
LVLDTGRTVAAVAREINVGATVLSRWVAKERSRIGPLEPEPLGLDERAELEALRKEVGDLRIDVEFLGKASAFFAARSMPRGASR